MNQTYTKYLRFYFIIFMIIVGINIVSTLFFLNNPKSFYFRPYEYFDEVAYQLKGTEATWDDIATSDLTRDNYFYYQDEHHLLVTTDKDGFRTPFMQSPQYRVLVSGDSTIFGSGLSDSETMPWKLSEKIAKSVFNGGRSALHNTLQRKELAQVEIVIDGITERSIKGSVFVAYSFKDGDAYQPLKKNSQDPSSLYKSITPARYLATSKLTRLTRRLVNDLNIFINGGEKKWLFKHHKMQPADLEKSILNIKRRQIEMTSKGIRYIFVAIPAKQTLYAENIDDYTKNYIHMLTSRLKQEGIETINLLSVFEQEAPTSQLYRHFDTHWNEKGTTLAANTIAQYLINNP